MRQVQLLDRQLRDGIVAAGAVSLVFWSLLQLLLPPRGIPWSEEMLAASRNMQRAIATVARHCETAGVATAAELDPNRTCLIGPEYGELFTTLGQLESKRTSTNPDVAGLLVHLLRAAGASAGDTLAVGASASFPALVVATQIAAEAMGLHPVMVLSLGASSYGAIRPELNLLDIHELLLGEGILSTPAAAISLGGEEDVGRDLGPAVRDLLLKRIREGGIPLVGEADLRRNVALRMEIYGGPPAAFVNVGGGEANLGTSPLVLRVEPGLNAHPALPPRPQRGVLFEMAALDVPVIHLLNVRGLAQRYGLPWDPVPLPQPGTTTLRDDFPWPAVPFWLLTAAYFAALGLILVTSFERLRARLTGFTRERARHPPGEG